MRQVPSNLSAPTSSDVGARIRFGLSMVTTSSINHPNFSLKLIKLPNSSKAKYASMWWELLTVKEVHCCSYCLEYNTLYSSLMVKKKEKLVQDSTDPSEHLQLEHYSHFQCENNVVVTNEHCKMGSTKAPSPQEPASGKKNHPR